MPLLPLYGHHDARRTLARAAAADTLPHSILLHGPRGIGRQRFGLWIAQLLLCEAPEAGEPCGRCTACRLVLRLEHPDVHWFFPLPRPEGAATPERLRQKLEEARAAELAARREDPLHLPSYDRPPAHFLAAIQSLQQLAGVRPAMGARKIFVVGDAEAMVPQESSPEAANAFLKLLEEPPSGTYLVLTAEQPGALLPTILSRVLPVRLLPLEAREVASFLAEHRGLAPAAAADVAARSSGAIGRALRLLPSDNTPGPLEAERQKARALLEAALAESAVGRLALAHDAESTGARGDFLGLLDAFAVWLRDLLAVASGAPESVVNTDALDLFERAVMRGISPAGVARVIEKVAAARGLAEGNVNPRLILADLLRAAHSELRPATAATARR